MPTARLFDGTACELGEGPFWHPERRALFWFDILHNRLLSRSASEFRQWQFDEHVSAAGWIDRDTLLVASETRLFRLNLVTREQSPVVDLEADTPKNRSNDGRADPWGGFWIGTMSKKAEAGAGAIYRFHDGALTKLFGRITIPNSIAFSPDRTHATFADTVTGKVMRQRLNSADGAPVGEPEVYLDLTAEGLNPDGAVFDAEGCLWLAEWGSSRVCRYAPDGERLSFVEVPTPHTSCPAFGGEGYQTLFCTTAQEGLDVEAPGFSGAGRTYAATGVGQGFAAPQVTI